MDTKCFKPGIREYFDTLYDTFSKVDIEQIVQMAEVL